MCDTPWYITVLTVLGAIMFVAALALAYGAIVYNVAERKALKKEADKKQLLKG